LESYDDTRKTKIDSDIILWIYEEPLDENNDSTFDIFYLHLELNISVRDKYRIFASMAPSNIAVDDIIKQIFTAGKHNITLDFDGLEIYKSSQNGPYTFEILVYNDNGDVIEKIEYVTQKYFFEEFNPTPSTTITGTEEISVKDNTIRLVTNTFEAVIYELSPHIEFYYTSDNGQVAKFKVTYDKIICFNDENNDNHYQANELRYWGDLLNSQWNSPKVLMDNFNNFDFQVQTILGLMDSYGDLIDTKLEIVFHYSSLIKSGDKETSRKFDINLKILGAPLEGSVSHIALQHSLLDEFGNHEVVPKDGGSSDRISFLSHDNEERGYYSWKTSVERTEKNGRSTHAVTYNLGQSTDSSNTILFIIYPYSMDTVEIFHDPEVGVNPENKPLLPGEIDAEVINHGQWIFLYLLVAIIVGSIIAGNIYHQKKKREED
jgi:hypothetical protein